MRKSLHDISLEGSMLEVRANKEKGLTEDPNLASVGARKLKTFQKLSWEVMMMCSICKMFRKGLEEFVEYEIIAAISHTQKQRRDSLEADRKCRQLTFDQNLFRKSQDYFPPKAVNVTLKRPEWRTEEEMKLLRSFLQVLPSYRRYSSNMQLMLAKVVRYERFGRRRVVLKNGHAGNSFYFLYSGCVAVTKDKDGSSAFIDKEPILLRRGDGFGEIALLKGSRRNASVVCMEDTELLVVDKEDFFANKLDLEQEKEFKYRYDFFRSLDLFSTWPEKLIENIAGQCKAEKFHHGQVVIWDSSETSSITFISKGSCQLLRLVDLINCPSYHKWISQQTDLRLTSTKSDPRPISRKRFKSIMLNSYPLLDPVYQTPSPPLSSSRPRYQQAEKMKLALPPLFDQVDELSRRQERRASNRLPEVTIVDPKERHSVMVSTPHGEIHRGVAAAVYLRINVLHQGEFLGLHQHLVPWYLQDNRSMVLISNGAEIIKLKKDKFDELADGATITSLRKLERTYPTDDMLCQMFLEQNRWKLFKKDLVNMLVEQRAVTPRSRSFIQTSMSLNQAGMLDLFSVSHKRHKSAPRQEPTFIPVSGKGKKGAEGLPEIETQLIHGITMPRAKLNRLLQ